MTPWTRQLSIILKTDSYFEVPLQGWIWEVFFAWYQLSLCPRGVFYVYSTDILFWVWLYFNSLMPQTGLTWFPLLSTVAHTPNLLGVTGILTWKFFMPCKHPRFDRGDIYNSWEELLVHFLQFRWRGCCVLKHESSKRSRRKNNGGNHEFNLYSAKKLILASTECFDY
jgi:hypothetical protein